MEVNVHITLINCTYILELYSLLIYYMKSILIKDKIIYNFKFFRKIIGSFIAS